MRKDWVRVSVLLGYNRPKLWWHPRFALSIFSYACCDINTVSFYFDSGMAFLTFIVNSAII